MTAPDLSIVIPALNERESLPGLLEEIERVCAALDRSWEAIVVDDGSSDGTFELIAELAAAKPAIGAIRLRRNFGKSAALATGFDHCRGKVIVTIDGDGQDDPADLPALLAALDSVDLVSGWKQNRRDPFSRRIASRVYNWVTARLTGVSMHDMNCGFKAYRAECARSLSIYGELHRYMPVLADQQGWRVTEVPVNHRPRAHGRSRFGLERYVRGALDLLTVVFMGRYGNRPVHLFGGLGLGLTAVGLLICAYLTVLKIAGESLSGRPLLFLGVLLTVVGIQLTTFGLLAQMIVAARRESAASSLSPAQIERVLGCDPLPSATEAGSELSARGSA